MTKSVTNTALSSSAVSTRADSSTLSKADKEKHVSLCEALDRLLNKGAVLKGEITISIANVDLVYLGFHVLLASVDTAREMLCPTQPATKPQGRLPC